MENGSNAKTNDKLHEYNFTQNISLNLSQINKMVHIPLSVFSEQAKTNIHRPSGLDSIERLNFAWFLGNKALFWRGPPRDPCLGRDPYIKNHCFNH